MRVLERLYTHGAAMAVVILGALVLIDAVFAGDITIITSFAVAPLVAATTSTVGRTAAIAGLAVAFGLIARLWNEGLATNDWASRVAMCAVISAFAVLIASGRIRRVEALGRMRVIADTAQRALLRGVPPEIEDLRLAARYVSATAEALIGGDLYEVAPTQYGVRLIIGDVRGKGIEAVQLAAAAIAAFRQSAYTRDSLLDVVADLERLIHSVSGEEEFVTALLAEYAGEGALTLVNCGHHPPLVVLQGEGAELADTGEPTFPLGLGLGPSPTMVHRRLPAGARVLFYTDGLVEARDPQGEFFPLITRARVIADASPNTALDRLLAHLIGHTGQELDDDLALLLIERT